MSNLEDEIGEFWNKSIEEIEKDLREAGLDVQPTLEAVGRLLRRLHHLGRVIVIGAHGMTAGSKAA